MSTGALDDVVVLELGQEGGQGDGPPDFFSTVLRTSPGWSPRQL